MFWSTEQPCNLLLGMDVGSPLWPPFVSYQVSVTITSSVSYSLFQDSLGRGTQHLIWLGDYFSKLCILTVNDSISMNASHRVWSLVGWLVMVPMMLWCRLSSCFKICAEATIWLVHYIVGLNTQGEGTWPKSTVRLSHHMRLVLHSTVLARWFYHPFSLAKPPQITTNRITLPLHNHFQW